MLQMLVFAMAQWGILTAVIARSKHRNIAGWFALGAVLPLLGLVLAIVASPKPRADQPVLAAA